VDESLAADAQVVRQHDKGSMTGGDAQMRADIATYGWHVIKVYEDVEGPAFAFTILVPTRVGGTSQSS
jgi:hypothetical protein